jgi:hypothetical protein
MLVKFDDALLDDFAEMASFAGINDDFPRRRHGWQFISWKRAFQGWLRTGGLRALKGAATLDIESSR